MARELKIPAEGGGWHGGGGEEAADRLAGPEGRVPCTSYVLDEVDVVSVTVVLVHALTGRPLPLEMSSLWRALIGRKERQHTHTDTHRGRRGYMSVDKGHCC